MEKMRGHRRRLGALFLVAFSLSSLAIFGSFSLIGSASVLHRLQEIVRKQSADSSTPIEGQQPGGTSFHLSAGAGDAEQTARPQSQGPGISHIAGLGRRMAVVEGAEEDTFPGLQEDPEELLPKKDSAQDLLQAWSKMYGLEDPGPPDPVEGHAAQAPIARAPHLQECRALTDRRRRAEEFDSAGRYPKWACSSVRDGATQFCSNPRPPWVPGSDEDNLNLTRVVQRDLWVRQFPPGNCSHPSLKFLMVDWWNMYYHGIGSKIHLMSSAFSLAYASGRILVPTPHTFHRANHAACEREGQRGSLACYFFPITSPQCVSQAWSLYRRLSPEEMRYGELSVTFLSAGPRVVRLFRGKKDGAEWLKRVLFPAYLSAQASQIWGKPWDEGERTSQFELLGNTLEPYKTDMAQANWWRSQSVRFMLRWPTAYLCHLINKVRHGSYGPYVAQRVVQAAEARERLLGTRPGGGQGVLDLAEKEMLLQEPPEKMGSKGRPVDMTDAWRMRDEAFIPRPIISMHVRQGDKAVEMKLFSLQSYMWLAERVRMLVPDISYVWLSTEMQSVVDESKEYRDWRFLYTHMRRQVGSTRMIDYEREVGWEEEVGNSFANLVIAAECDYFVGVLGSNWNRLINELRLTNGRKHRSYMALNNDEY